MLAVVPLCAVPLTARWDGIASLPSGAVFPLQAQTIGEQVWLVEIGAQTDGAGSGVAPGGLVGLAIAPLAAPDWPADVASEAPVIRVSDRGWIGEPWDTVAPNTPYPPRLAEPVALEASLPIYPDTVRRLAVTTGEVRLLNGDGQLDALAGDWAVAGQTVTLHRGPHWRPLHAPLAAFVRIATLRAAGAAVGTSRLAIPLRPAAAALDVPVCATYAGSGGAEGPATLTGQFKPRLYGLKRNVDPVLVDPGLLLFQVHDGSIDSILAVRDRGVALTGTPAAPTAAANTNTTQLATTAFVRAQIPAEFTGANQSFAATGYQKLPGGLILQWTNITIGSGGSTWTFPTAFPTACYFVGGNPAGASVAFADTLWVGTLSASQVALDFLNTNINNAYVFALGR